MEGEVTPMQLYSAVRVLSDGHRGTIVDFDYCHDEPVHLVEYTDVDFGFRLHWVEESDLVEVEPRIFPPVTDDED